MAVSESAVDRTVEVGVRERLLSIPNWRGFNNPWMPIDEADVEYSYINLKQNPERYTGYKVHHALNTSTINYVYSGPLVGMLCS